MQEKWIDEIPGYENVTGYKVRNDGVIISYKENIPKIIKGYFDTKKYLLVDFGINTRAVKIHRIVAKAFILNPDNLPQVNHINGIKTDNRIENLEWCNNSDNQIHALRNGLKPRKISEEDIKWICENWGTTPVRDMCMKLGYDQSTLHKLYKGKLKSYNNILKKYKAS